MDLQNDFPARFMLAHISALLLCGPDSATARFAAHVHQKAELKATI
jgi:hypothetical protein